MTEDKILPTSEESSTIKEEESEEEEEEYENEEFKVKLKTVPYPESWEKIHSFSTIQLIGPYSASFPKLNEIPWEHIIKIFAHFRWFWNQYMNDLGCLLLKYIIAKRAGDLIKEKTGRDTEWVLLDLTKLKTYDEYLDSMNKMDEFLGKFRTINQMINDLHVCKFNSFIEIYFDKSREEIVKIL